MPNTNTSTRVDFASFLRTQTPNTQTCEYVLHIYITCMYTYIFHTSNCLVLFVSFLFPVLFCDTQPHISKNFPSCFCVFPAFVISSPWTMCHLSPVTCLHWVCLVCVSSRLCDSSSLFRVSSAPALDDCLPTYHIFALSEDKSLYMYNWKSARETTITFVLNASGSLICCASLCRN